jgi:hypothetical protein
VVSLWGAIANRLLCRASRIGLAVAATVAVCVLSGCGGSSGASTSSKATDVAAQAGLPTSSRTFGAVIFDYNNDGWPDIFLSRHDQVAWLFRNTHGRFVRVKGDVFPARSDRHECSAADFNGDGRLDLFCPVGGESGLEPKHSPDQLWIQQANGTFIDDGKELPADPYGRSRHSLVLDANGDRRPDILIGNVSPRSDGKPSLDRLFLNEGDGKWRDAPEFGLHIAYSVGGAGVPGSQYGGGDHPLGCLQSLDAAKDGRTDVLMCAKSPTDKSQSLHLFHNDDGHKFTEVTQQAGLGKPAWDAVVADMNGDGWPDIVSVNTQGLTVCLNDQHGHFTVGYQLPVTDALRLAVADANGDGHPDIYVMRTHFGGDGLPSPGPDVADVILVSRGTYNNYTKLTLPKVAGTVRADDVVPIDYKHNGKPAFLVLDGANTKPGPIQLIAVS